MSPDELPLLPLVLDNVPPGLDEALAQEGVPFCRRRPGAPAGRFVLFDSRAAAAPELIPGQTAIDVHPMRRGDDRSEGGEGNDDLFAALVDTRAQRHQWRIGGLVVSEQIARVDRRAVRRRLLDKLRAAVERAGGVWLGLSAFPFPYRSALNFRIDHDEYEPIDFDAVMETIAGHESATSHFVCGSAFEAHPAAIARLAGMDVGSHGYWHHTYRAAAENLRNIRRGIEVLQRHGIEPSGFAAPHGRYYPALAAVLEQLGVGHSSEFGLAHDDLPFFPAGSCVLQIPIHPVCLGIFLETVQGEGTRHAAATRQAVRAAADHFRETTRTKYHAGEPVFLYGHPTSRLGCYPQVLQAVFEAAADFGAIWKTTLSRFAHWWRQRAAARLVVTRRKDQFVVTADGLPAEYRLAIEYWRGAHVARVPLESGALRFWPAALAYENRAAARQVRPVRLDRPEGLRPRLRRLVDWEKVTPVEEIPMNTWRNIAKRALRRLKK